MIVKYEQVLRKIPLCVAFIAMGLSFMAHLSPLWAKRGDGQAILICSTFGNRTIIIDDNGNEIPVKPSQNTGEHCVMCLNAGLDYGLPDKAHTEHPAPTIKALKHVGTTTSFAHQQHGANDNAIRAPPYSS